MKKRLKWLLGILLALIVIVIIDMMICIHQYGKGKVTPWQVLEVNLFHKMVALEEHDQGMLFLTDHDWTGDELLKRGYRETAWGVWAIIPRRTEQHSVSLTGANGASSFDYMI